MFCYVSAIFVLLVFVCLLAFFYICIYSFLFFPQTLLYTPLHSPSNPWLSFLLTVLAFIYVCMYIFIYVYIYIDAYVRIYSYFCSVHIILVICMIFFFGLFKDRCGRMRTGIFMIGVYDWDWEISGRGCMSRNNMMKLYQKLKTKKFSIL